ncbi:MULTISPECIES: DUF6046 domain-containing protein [Bizionia]|uniref:DUF6046 domain-containing protein n=1 Tax=Bizionia algoritergicola TaxID=291187 RepID=A0A5D0R146_9FLAO|nr:MULTISPECIES: DUF6046 domain-containing protein [Bizionia]OBX20958.1 hypothetical protein BAA08_14565 [Bizionia sp. APA-3]TYB74591.1 hypothetical protein ES675_00155 [Bizionia algoritergicola]
MIQDKTGIIFSSLIGVAKTNRFQVVQNELSKHVLPPIPFLGYKRKDQIGSVKNDISQELWKANAPLSADDQFFPFYFVGSDGVKYLLPYEPMINIGGKNTIIRRNVAKAKTKGGREVGGSIKERWNQGDYDISITGVLIGSLLTGNVEDCFPREDFEKLRDFMTTPKSLKVYCEPLQLLGINQIVIEDFSFPFTKGENVQAYEIKCYSDFDYKLLLDIDD